MRVTAAALPGVLLIEPELHVDPRGYFLEVWQQARYGAAGVRATFVQDNVSCSRAGVLRGLHLQHPYGQAKLVSVTRGEILDVAVDVRRGSPTFGRWAGYTLSHANHRQLYIPAGFAHGFVVTSEDALVAYKVSAYRDAASEVTIAWDDPDVGIEWGVSAPLVSDRDRAAPRLRDLAPERLPEYAAWPPTE